MTDQAAGLRRMANSRSSESSHSHFSNARVICVTSGKGGVGKTNISVNLSLALAQMGYRTALLDADLGMANVDIILGMSPQYTLAHVLRGEKQVHEVLIDGPHGLKILAGGSGVYDLANLSQYELDRFAQSLETLDSQFDFIFVDTGAGLSRNVINFALAVDEILVVTTPEPTAITDAYGMIKVIKQRNPDSRVNLIVNMIHHPQDGENVWKKLNTVVGRFLHANIEFAGSIAYDTHVSRSVTQQTPLLLAFPNSSSSRSIAAIAQVLVGQNGQGDIETPRGIRGFFKKVYNLLQT